MTIPSIDILKQQLHAYIADEILVTPGISLQHSQSLINEGIIGSFAVIQVVSFIEATYGVHVPDAQATSDYMDTIDAMAAVVTRLAA